jgi:class 3 adenylate cyclase
MSDGEVSGSLPRVRSAELLTERAAAIVDDVLARTARRNERGVSRGRLAVCAAFLLRELAFFGDDLLAGNRRDLISVVTLALGIALSVLHLKRPDLRYGPVSQRLLSVLLDLFVFGAAIFSLVLLPDDHYAGVLRAHTVGAGTFVIAAAGLRLERRFVIVATAGVLGVIGTACVLDLARQPALVTWGAGSVAYYAVVFLGFGLFADIVAGRTRDIALDTAREAFLAERARERFGAYVGREVAAVALAARDVVMGGKRQPVAVLFCDLRGFTTTSEQQTPEEVVRQLNAYFEVMVAVIHAHGGVVDKYVGDAIMAVFGAPRGQPDDARRAVKAALAMEHALRLHNAARHKDGLPSLKIGVGVHYGDVVAGNIGTTRHAQYTVIGDVVNLASRLEGATRDHGVAVLVSREAKDAAEAADDVEGGRKPLPLRALGTIKVKGREGGVDVYGPLPPVEYPALAATWDGDVSNPSNPLLSSIRRG